MATKILPADESPAYQPIRWDEIGSRQECASATNSTGAAPRGHSPDELAQMTKLQMSRDLDAARRAGETDGRQMAQAELEREFQTLARAVESIGSYKARLRQEAERDVVALALAVARRILRRQIQVDDEAILGLVKAAMENLSLREVTEVRLHPRHAAAAQACLAAMGAADSLVVTGDRTLEEGAVLVETTQGTFDASVETQLDEIARGMADALAPVRRLR